MELEKAWEMLCWRMRGAFIATYLRHAAQAPLISVCLECGNTLSTGGKQCLTTGTEILSASQVYNWATTWRKNDLIYLLCI